MSQNPQIEKESAKKAEQTHLEELKSLGVDPTRRTELNDENELAELADNIKQCMIHDYMLAYSEKGDRLEKESKATLGHKCRGL